MSRPPRGSDQTVYRAVAVIELNGLTMVVEDAVLVGTSGWRGDLLLVFREALGQLGRYSVCGS